MTQSLSLSWSALGVKIPQSTVSIEKLSHHDLILRCQEGKQPDRIAFAELLRRYQSHVDRLLYHLAPDWQDRADLSQEVWIRVYRHLKRLQDPLKFKGWLSRIATNLFYDELRKRKRLPPSISLDATRHINDDELDWELPSDYPSPDEQLTTAEFYDLLHRAIADLPESFRITIILREIDGLAYEDIAEITGASLGTVKSRIARARAKLQSVLQNYWNGR